MSIFWEDPRGTIFIWDEPFTSFDGYFRLITRKQNRLFFTNKINEV